MPETSLVLSDDAVGQVFVLASFFLLALYFVVKRAVVAALRTAHSEQSRENDVTSIDHYGG